MIQAEFQGTFDSGYTMRRKDVTDIIPDCITFKADDKESVTVGRGIKDENGCVMQLKLREDGKGTWREVETDGSEAYGGEVEFVSGGDGRLYGAWSMHVADTESEQAKIYGTWVLTKRLGSRAVKSS